MNREIVVSVDAMGGDNAPQAIIDGLGVAHVRHPKVKFLVHGDHARLQPILLGKPTLKNVAQVMHCDAVVAMDEKPSQAIRRRNTSMSRAVESVRNEEAQVAISAGNTGALMAISMFPLRTIHGISRPAIAAIWPTMRGQTRRARRRRQCRQRRAASWSISRSWARPSRASIFGLERPTRRPPQRRRRRNEGPRGSEGRGAAPARIPAADSTSTASSKATTSPPAPSMSSSPTASPATSRSRLRKAPRSSSATTFARAHAALAASASRRSASRARAFDVLRQKLDPARRQRRRVSRASTASS